MAKVKNTTTTAPEGTIMYTEIDIPESAKPKPVTKENPYTDGVTRAKGFMVDAPGKALSFTCEAGKVVKQINTLRRAGTGLGVSVRTKAYKGTTTDAAHALSSKLDVYDAMPAGDIITIVFWTVPAIKREKKTPASVESAPVAP